MIAMKHSLTSSTPREDAPSLDDYMNHSDMNLAPLIYFRLKNSLTIMVSASEILPFVTLILEPWQKNACIARAKLKQRLISQG